MKNKAYWLIGLLLVAVLAGCGGELYDECDEDDDACWEMLEAEFDEEYDDEFDGEDDEYDDEAGWGWDYVETAEDCYEDEYFDEADQLCYPNWEDEDCDDEDCFADEGGIFSFFEGLLGTGIGGSYGEFDEAGNSAIISYQIEGNQLVNPERGEGDDPAGHAENVEVHQQIWERFIRLIPAQNR
ncbi:MAG TPA: hypothetical protein VLL52_00775, partial [Anaerolineae bacterium]|nr:hypothetical protein [Anaerolineae bacterium]